MGRPRTSICPRCKEREKVAGRGYCGPCHTERERERRARNPAPYRAASRRWQARNQESVRVRMRAWEAANREKILANRRRRDAKMRARDAVKYALQTGRLVRPDRCDRCRKRCRPQAHHTDYTKRLLVEWLCRACHGKEHRAE